MLRDEQGFTKREKPLPTTPKVTSDEITFVLLIAARSPQVFSVMEAKAPMNLFHSSEPAATLFWRSLLHLHKTTTGLPFDDKDSYRTLLKVAVSREAATGGPEFYSKEIVDLVVGDGGWVDTAFEDITVDDKTLVYCFDIIKRLLVERLLLEPLKVKMLNVADSKVFEDPYKIINDADRLAADIAGIGMDPGFDAVGTELYTAPVVKIYPTGLDWLDAAMGGGHAPGEAYLVMGGTGSGKTSLMVQLAVSGAKIQAENCKGHKRRLWLYFSYELSRRELEPRVHSFGAKIDSETFMSVNPSYRQLTTKKGPLKDYELHPIVNPSPDCAQSEEERLKAFQAELAGNWLKLVDYSGAIPGTGIGGLNEIIAYCQRVKDAGYDIAGVVIDYMGLVVSRNRQTLKNSKPSDDYEALNGFIDSARFQLAIPMHCPVWVLHQLKGETKNLAPGQRLTISHGRGGRNLGDNCDFAFLIGNLDIKQGVRAIWADKTRRVRPIDGPIIVRFDGKFGMFYRNPDDEFVVESGSRKIITSKELNDFRGAGLAGLDDPLGLNMFPDLIT